MSESFSQVIVLIAQNKEAIGSILQVVGVLYVFYVHARFYLKAKREFGSVVKAIYDTSVPRVGMNDDEIRKATDEELRRNPLTDLLFRNYRNSFIGAIFTLSGVIISLLPI